MATKQDLQLLRTELKAEMDVRFAEVRAGFAEVRVEFAELRAQFADLRTELSDLRTELHKTLRVHMFAMVAVMLTGLGIVG